MKIECKVGSAVLLPMLILIIGFGCQDTQSDDEETLEKETSTFDIIQADIFEANCVSCHTAGTSFALQSGLVLTKDEAFAQLVDRMPNNPAARNDGLVLVGSKGLESIPKSFLWEKINTPNFEHFYADHPLYGELMPLGGLSLTNGELRFIHDWIVMGAPKEGMVVDPSILNDDTRFVIPDSEFSIFEPPEQGVQLHVGPFDVWPNAERELFQYQSLNNSEDIYVDKIEIRMRGGSHHFLIYDYPDGNSPRTEDFRDFWNSNGTFNIATAASILDARFVFGTQWRETSYQFPPGVALRIPANAGLDLNSHYVNSTNDLKMGEVSINLHTTPPSTVQFVAENLFENYTDFSLPPMKETTIVRSSTFDEAMQIFQLTSHAHQHMTEFRIYFKGGDRHGELIYYTNDWEHPPILEYDPPISVQPGQGFTAEATYMNDTDRTLRFGLLSEDEMMIVFGSFFRQ